MIGFLYKRFYYRLIFGVAAGLVGYLIVILLFSLQYRYYTVSLRPVDILSFILVGLFMTESMIWTHRWLNRRFPWIEGPFRRVVVQVLFGILITFVVVIVLRIAVILLLFPHWLLILADEVSIFLVVLFLVVVFDLMELGIFLNRNYINSMAELERFRKENAEYKFEMLRLQLNPHFLFNSLNTLSSLVHEDAEKATEFTRKLSDVYRYVLDNRDKELVKLKQEMDFISAFIYLLGIRFQGMVFFQVDIDKQALEKQIAPMTLQLLIENAVKHNVASRHRPLTIRLYTNGDDLWVTNNLQLKDKSENTGVALGCDL